MSFEEAVYEFAVITKTQPKEVPLPIQRAFLFTSIAFVGSSYIPSYNKYYEKTRLLVYKDDLTGSLAGFTKICMFFEALPVPYGNGSPEYRTWSDGKLLEKLLVDVKTDKLWKENEIKDEKDKDIQSKICRNMLRAYFDKLEIIWNQMISICPKTTLVAKTGKAHFSATIKGSCYISMVFKSILMRIRTYGLNYVWDVKLLTKKELQPVTLSDIFTNYKGPFETDPVIDPKELKKSRFPNVVTVRVRKRKSVNKTNNVKRKKIVKRGNTEAEEAKFKALEAKVGIISHALTMALEKLETLTNFVETIASKVT